MKDEYFYFSDYIDMDKNSESSKEQGFIEVKPKVVHTMQSNHGDVWFHSLNMPDILNDSLRL